MIHYAACVWCQNTFETGDADESLALMADHILRCDDGPIKTVLDILEKYANPYVAERAKEEIRCKVLR